MKEERLKLIEDFIRSGRVSSQDEVLTELRKRRIRVNQSTLSRDFAELNIRKVEGVYGKVESESVRGAGVDLSRAVRSWQTCGHHLIILSTAIGQAQSIGVAIDRKDDPALAGTLAGDDTLFLATKNRQQQAVVLRRLAQWFGEKQAR